MKNSFNLLAASLIVFLFGLGCTNLSSKEKNTNVSNSTGGQDIVVELDFTIDGIETNRPKISGQTNLPDGTNLLISLEKASPFELKGQSRGVVTGGKFESEQFSDNGSKLAPGEYQINVTMPVAKVQPESVRKQIGEKGEKLKGELVKADTGLGLGPTAQRVKTFTLK